MFRTAIKEARRKINLKRNLRHANEKRYFGEKNMKATIAFLDAPLEEGELPSKWDYVRFIEFPALPRVGDTIRLFPVDKKGDFIHDEKKMQNWKTCKVENVTWDAHDYDDGTNYATNENITGEVKSIVIWVTDLSLTPN